MSTAEAYTSFLSERWTLMQALRCCSAILLPRAALGWVAAKRRGASHAARTMVRGADAFTAFGLKHKLI